MCVISWSYTLMCNLEQVQQWIITVPLQVEYSALAIGYYCTHQEHRSVNSLGLLQSYRNTKAVSHLTAKLAPTVMVTQSKFRSMSRALDSSLRLKTFSSRSEYNLVLSAVHKLQESGFYWSTVTGTQANILLSTEPAGTFLIRDSSDHRHFFTLSVKTETGTKNLRIQCEPCGFSLQTDPRSSQPVPRFDCVLKLLRHYMSAKDSGNAKRSYYIYSGGERVPLLLSRPLSSSVSSLQHLCRKAVNGQLEDYGAKEQLPLPIKDFLQEYDSPV